MRTKITFKRKGTFEMTGGAEIDLDERDFGELYMKACREEFKSFLPTEIIFHGDDWEFDFLEEEKAVG